MVEGMREVYLCGRIQRWRTSYSGWLMELARKVDEGATRGRSSRWVVRRGLVSGERKTQFIKYDIAGDIQSTRNGIQTTVSLVRCTVAQEGTMGGSVRELVRLIGTKKWIAGTSEGAQ